MDVWIRFIGLMLFYQAHANAPYHVIIPKWDHDNICQTCIMEHTPFVRIGQGDVLNDSQWTEKKECTTEQHCTLYLVPDGSTLSVEPGFKSAMKDPDTLPCLVPNFKREKLVGIARLHPDAFTTRSAADFTLPNGKFFAHQFGVKPDGTPMDTNKGACGPIFVALRVPAPAGATDAKVLIIATPRSGGTPHVLIVKAGTVIDIMNVPPTHALMSDDIVEKDPDTNLQRHFFFLHKLLDDDALDRENPTANCKPIPLHPAGCKARCKTGHGVTHSLGCGPGGLVATDGGGQ